MTAVIDSSRHFCGICLTFFSDVAEMTIGRTEACHIRVIWRLYGGRKVWGLLFRFHFCAIWTWKKLSRWRKDEGSVVIRAPFWFPYIQKIRQKTSYRNAGLSFLRNLAQISIRSRVNDHKGSLQGVIFALSDTNISPEHAEMTVHFCHGSPFCVISTKAQCFSSWRSLLRDLHRNMGPDDAKMKVPPFAGSVHFAWSACHCPSGHAKMKITCHSRAIWNLKFFIPAWSAVLCKSGKGKSRIIPAWSGGLFLTSAAENARTAVISAWSGLDFSRIDGIFCLLIEFESNVVIKEQI